MSSPRILFLVAATVSVWAYVERSPVDIFVVTKTAFGLNQTDFEEIAARGRMKDVYDKMRKLSCSTLSLEDLDSISWLRERGGDAYDFIIELITRAWYVARDHYDKRRASEGINTTYHKLSREDRFRLLLPFPAFRRIFVYDSRYAIYPYDGNPDDFYDIASDHRKLSLLEVRRLLWLATTKTAKGSNQYFAKVRVLIEDLLYENPWAWNRDDLREVFKAFLMEFRQFLEKYDDEFSGNYSKAVEVADNITNAIRILCHVIDHYGSTAGQSPLVNRIFDRPRPRCGPDQKCYLYHLLTRLERVPPDALHLSYNFQ